MPVFERLSPNYIKHFISRIKSPQNFSPRHILDSDGVLSIQKPLSDGEEKHLQLPFFQEKTFNYGFELAPIPIRFGRGFTADIGYEIEKLKPRNPVVFTDLNVAKTKAVIEARKSLNTKKLSYDIFEEVPIEPTDKSLAYAVEFVRNKNYDCFISIGGSSVMDTARIAALFASNPSLKVEDLVKQSSETCVHSKNSSFPLISIPTTFSLGSESAGSLSYHIEATNSMGVICNDDVKPSLIIADPLNVLSVPKNVAAYGAFDLLVHALEAYTIKEFTPHISNMPYITGTELQMVFKLTNLISDDWAAETLRIMKKYLQRAVLEQEDVEARSHLLLASTFSSIGFRNPSVRLCHSLAYPIRTIGKNVTDAKYATSKVPHGLAVAMMAPAVFKFSAYAEPERHLEAARLLGANLTSSASPHQIGEALAEILRGYMKALNLPNGLSELGFKFEELFKLSEMAGDCFKAASNSSKELDKEVLREIYEEIWKIY